MLAGFSQELYFLSHFISRKILTIQIYKDNFMPYALPDFFITKIKCFWCSPKEIIMYAIYNRTINLKTLFQISSNPVFN